MAFWSSPTQTSTWIVTPSHPCQERSGQVSVQQSWGWHQLTVQTGLEAEWLPEYLYPIFCMAGHPANAWRTLKVLLGCTHLNAWHKQNGKLDSKGLFNHKLENTVAFCHTAAATLGWIANKQCLINATMIPIIWHTQHRELPADAYLGTSINEICCLCEMLSMVHWI